MAVPGVLEAEHPLPVLLGAVHHPHPHGRGVDRAQHLVDGLRLEVPVVGALFVGPGAAAARAQLSSWRNRQTRRRGAPGSGAAQRARATTDIALFFVRRWRGCARPVLRLIAFRPFVRAAVRGRRGARNVFVNGQRRPGNESGVRWAAGRILIQRKDAGEPELLFASVLRYASFGKLRRQRSVQAVAMFSCTLNKLL